MYVVYANSECSGPYLQTLLNLRCSPIREVPCADPERGGGGRGRTPLKITKNIGFFSNTGPDPLKNHKAAKPAFNVGHYRSASETSFQWRFADRPIIARLWCFLSLDPLKNVLELDPF